MQPKIEMFLDPIVPGFIHFYKKRWIAMRIEKQRQIYKCVRSVFSIAS